MILEFGIMLKRGLGSKFCQLLKDIIFPLYCLDCGVEGSIVCAECVKKISADGVFCCPVCHMVNKDGSCCEICQPATKLEQHVALMPYREQGLIGKITHILKYQFVIDVLKILEPIIKKFSESHSSFFCNVEVVVPVPLHRRRFAERGFNQAELIAGALARSLGLPLISALQRQKQTEQQAKLTKAEREANIRSAFSVADSADVLGKEVIVVDDVYTTGSTIQECAAALKSAGAKRVVGFTVARG